MSYVRFPYQKLSNLSPNLHGSVMANRWSTVFNYRAQMSLFPASFARRVLNPNPRQLSLISHITECPSTEA